MRVKTDDKGNQRDRIIRVLRDSSNAKGYVRDMDVEGICRQTGIVAHDVAKHLWGLQKQGLIGFSTKHVHGKTVPYRFRLTSRMMNEPDQDTAGLGDHPAHSISAPARRAHRMGPDLLDPSTARARQLAESGVVEVTPGRGVTRVTTAIEQRGPGRLERMMEDALTYGKPDTAPEPTERPSPAVEPEPGIQAPPATEEAEEAAPVQEIAATIPVPQEVLDDAADFMDARRAPFTAEHYPEIHALMARVDKRERAEEAARALEAAGLDDLALAALDAIPDLNPLEREILAVVRGFRTPAWDEPGPSVRETIADIIEERT